MSRIAPVLFLSAFLLCSCSQASEPKSMITKDQLQEMFADMAQKTKWDMSKDMLWGYFFTDESKSELQSVVPLLTAQGYRFVDIYLSDKDDPSDPDVWWLHVEKVETHSPGSLHKRNQELYRFAEEHALDSYDGMDVGPVTKSH
ncbi:MAG: ribonuclease E inhibitor RraB [Arenimonas sp.]